MSMRGRIVNLVTERADEHRSSTRGHWSASNSPACSVSSDLLEHVRLERAHLKDTRLIDAVKAIEEGLIPQAQSSRGRVGFPEQSQDAGGGARIPIQTNLGESNHRHVVGKLPHVEVRDARAVDDNNHRG